MLEKMFMSPQSHREKQIFAIFNASKKIFKKLPQSVEDVTLLTLTKEKVTILNGLI